MNLCTIFVLIFIPSFSCQQPVCHIFAVINAWNGSSIFAEVIPSQPPVINNLALAPGMPLGQPVYSADYDSSTNIIYSLFSNPLTNQPLLGKFQIIDAKTVQTTMYNLSVPLFVLVADQHGNLFGFTRQMEPDNNYMIGKLVFNPSDVEFIPIAPVLGVFYLEGFGVFVSTPDDKIFFTGVILGSGISEYIHILMTLDLFTRDIASVNWGTDQIISAITRVNNQLVFTYMNGSDSPMNLASFISPETGTFNKLASPNFPISSNLAWDPCRKVLWFIAQETSLKSMNMLGAPVQQFNFTNTYFPSAPMFVVPLPN